jgi:hypothetical protein
MLHNQTIVNQHNNRCRTQSQCVPTRKGQCERDAPPEPARSATPAADPHRREQQRRQRRSGAARRRWLQQWPAESGERRRDPRRSGRSSTQRCVRAVRAVRAERPAASIGVGGIGSGGDEEDGGSDEDAAAGSASRDERPSVAAARGRRRCSWRRSWRRRWRWRRCRRRRCCCCCRRRRGGGAAAAGRPAAAGAPQATLSVLATEWLSTESASRRTHDADAATCEGASQSVKRAAPLVAPSTHAARPVPVAARSTHVERASGACIKHRSRSRGKAYPFMAGRSCTSK